MRARILDQLARGPGLVEQPRCLHEWILATARARPDALGYTNVRRCAGGEQDWTRAGLPIERGMRPKRKAEASGAWCSACIA